MQAAARSIAPLLRLVIALTAALLLSVAAAAAQDDERAEALDALFAELRMAPDRAAAQAIDNQIWTIWMTPSDPVLARRMGEALQARRFGDYRNAIRLLTDMIADYPDYAEAWNQRATIHYIMGNFEASIADCAEVLEREPRHFGALSGRAMMYLQQGKRPLALKDMTTALEIHPFLTERQLFPELQREITRI